MSEEKKIPDRPPCATIDGVMYWHEGKNPDSPDAVDVVCPACKQTFRTVTEDVELFPE